METNKRPRELSLSTIKAYNSCLNVLRTKQINIGELDYKTLRDYFDKSNIEPSTMRSYIFAIIYKLDEIDIESNKLIIYKNELEKELKRISSLLTSQKPSSTDKLTTWNTIKKIFMILTRKLDSQTIRLCPVIYQIYSILSLYILVPPRNSSDYSNLVLNNNVQIDENLLIDIDKINSDEYLRTIGLKEIDLTTIKKKTVLRDTEEIPLINITPDDEIKANQKIKEYIDTNTKLVCDIAQPLNGKNYYSSSGYISIEKHKTEKSYGSIYFKLPEKVTNILNTYIQLNSIQEGDLIFADSNKKPINFSSKIPEFFNKIIGKRVDIYALRNMYITETIKSSSNLHRQIIAKIMAHSMEDQVAHIVEDILPDVDEETMSTDIDKIIDKCKISDE